MAAVERSHIGFQGPSTVPLGKQHDPSQHVNQLQFNLHAPYAIGSLASNFQKPQPLIIEKFPMFAASRPTVHPVAHHGASIPSSPASSVSSERMHLAMQFAKIDAKKLWKEQKELEKLGNAEEGKEEVHGGNLKKVKATQGKAVKKTRRPNVGYVEYKSKKDRDVKRNLQVYQSMPNSDENVGSEEKQTREVRRLEKQIQNYLQRLDDLTHKGHEVIQKKDKRMKVRRSDKDDRSHLSDEDTDPRQYERAEEQAARSARMLYMIERQIQELDDEIHKKGRNMKQSKKSQTLGRLIAAQRATVRALRMLINSAPLQPKNSQHYPSIYQALTSLIHQLSLLAIQIEGGDESTIVQNARFDCPLKKHSEQRAGVSQGSKVELPKTKTKSNSNPAFSQQPAKKECKVPTSYTRRSCYQPLVKEPFPDDSALTVDATPERSATLKAGLEALLRAKEHERKRSRRPLAPAVSTKKKSVLLSQNLQAKRKKAHAAVQKTVKFPNETAHFTKDTTASRLKKVERQKATAKGETKFPKNVDNGADGGLAVVSEQTETRSKAGIDHKLQEREIERQLWLEDETKRKLRDVMDIPKSLVSEAEEAIKIKLKPILDQARAVVESSKAKSIQERFANIASKTTMQENEVLSEMILDDLLLNTAQEFQRLEISDEAETETSYLQNSSTLENILQQLEHFEKEEESIRRHLRQVSYVDTYETKQKRDTRQVPKEERGNVFTKEKDVPKTTSAAKPSADLKSRDKPPMPLILPPNLRESIFSYREKYSEYLKRTNVEHHGTFDPWQFVERLSDDILQEMIHDVAHEFSGACDDVMEMIFNSEFMKE